MIGQTSREMLCYKSHKEVWALKIKEVAVNVDGTAKIAPEDEGYASFSVDAEYVMRHRPKAGGYYVVYKDGYKSWSPADAFEEGYSRV